MWQLRQLPRLGRFEVQLHSFGAPLGQSSAVLLDRPLLVIEGDGKGTLAIHFGRHMLLLTNTVRARAAGLA